MEIWPNLFLVGAPKAGTTTLAKVFSNHPDIFISKIKEPNFFILKNDSENLINNGPTITSQLEYLKLFENSENFKYRCDASTAYLQYLIAAKNIKDKSPEAKIIITLRNPIERAFSHYHYHRSFSAEPLQTFEEALEAEKTRDKEGFWKHFLYTETGKYYKQVKNYLDLFGNEKVLVLFHENLHANPKEFYLKIFNFLQINSPKSLNYTSFENKGRKINSKKLSYKFYNYFSTSNFFSPFLNKLKTSIPENIKEQIRNILFQDKILLSTKKKLIEEFREDIENLQKLLKVDLSHWLE